MSDFPELEAELKKLRPAQLSADFPARVERAMRAANSSTATAAVLPRPRRFRINWLPLGLGIAAATVFLVLARLDVDRSAPKQSTLAAITPAPGQTLPRTLSGDLLPAGMTQVVYETRDEGLHFTEGAQRPVRRVRTQARETLQWRELGTGASLRVSYPREEVSLVPVTGQ